MHSPFTVAPSSATLAVNACMQVTIGFTPAKIGDHKSELCIHYDTGICHTVLYGVLVLLVYVVFFRRGGLLSPLWQL